MCQIDYSFRELYCCDYISDETWDLFGFEIVLWFEGMHFIMGGKDEGRRDSAHCVYSQETENEQEVWLAIKPQDLPLSDPLLPAKLHLLKSFKQLHRLGSKCLNT